MPYLVVNSGRMVQKILTNTGTPFAVAPSTDHTDGSWSPHHLYDGEFGIMSPDRTLWLRISGTVYQISVSGSSGVTLPTGTDTQTLRYNGTTLQANSILRNDGADIYIGGGGGGTGRLFSRINSAGQHNITLRNDNAGGDTVLEFQNDSGVEQYDVGMVGGELRIMIPTGEGLSLDTDGKFKVTQNDAAIHEIAILQNLNSSAPVYLVFLNSASAEKFYVGYRQAQTRFDILSADSLVGLTVDNTGRAAVGIYNSAYFAPDTGSVFTVETRSDLSSFGMTMRQVANAGVSAPINWQFTNSGSTLVYYANINSDIVSNANSAHYGKLVFQVAISGAMVTRLVIDENGIGVNYGGTGKNSVAANKMLVALSANTYSETPYFDVAEQTVVTTIVFTAGTAPATPLNLTYRWRQYGNEVRVRFNLLYTTAGATVTAVLIPKPADLPDPIAPAGFTGAGSIICYGSGGAATVITNVVGNQNKGYLRRNAANNGWEFGIDTASGSHKAFYCDVTYFTT